MIRLAWVIVALAALTAAAVHLRLEQARTRSDMCRLEAERLKVRRVLWNQQLRLGELTAPEHIRRLAEDWPFDLVGHGDPPPRQQVVRRRQ